MLAVRRKPNYQRGIRLRVKLRDLFPELEEMKKMAINEKELKEAISLVARSHATLIVETEKEKFFVSRYFNKKTSKYMNGYVHMSGIRYPVPAEMAATALLELGVRNFHFKYHEDL